MRAVGSMYNSCFPFFSNPRFQFPVLLTTHVPISTSIQQKNSILTSYSQDKKGKCDFYVGNWTKDTATPAFTQFPAAEVPGLANPNQLAPPGAIQFIVPVSGPMVAPGAGEEMDAGEDEGVVGTGKSHECFGCNTSGGFGGFFGTFRHGVPFA